MFVVWWPKQLLLELEIALKKVGHCIEVLIVLAWRRSLWKLPWMHPHAKRCIFVHWWSTNMMTTSPIYEIAGCVLVLKAKARCPKWAFLPKCPRFAHCRPHTQGKGRIAGILWEWNTQTGWSADGRSTFSSDGRCTFYSPSPGWPGLVNMRGKKLIVLSQGHVSILIWLTNIQNKKIN